MPYRIATELLDRILADAASAPEEERCGLLFGTSTGASVTVSEVAACRNVAADPARRFEIDPAALLAAHRGERWGGPGIVGCYHSHPSGDASPSGCDAASAAPNGWLWLIVADGTVGAWRAVADGAVLGRFEPVTRLPG